jgi:hypothetical protein
MKTFLVTLLFAIASTAVLAQTSPSGGIGTLPPASESPVPDQAQEPASTGPGDRGRSMPSPPSAGTQQ